MRRAFRFPTLPPRVGIERALPRVVFVHVPKCGGTTLHTHLLEWYGSEVTHPERLNGLANYAVDSFAPFKVFSGHYDLVSTDLIPGPKKLISTLREPMARLISYYNFLHAHRPEGDGDNIHRILAHRYPDINDFFTAEEVRALPAVNNRMVFQFASVGSAGTIADADSPAFERRIKKLSREACRKLRRFDAIGFQDSYDASLAHIARVLGFPKPAQPVEAMVLDRIMTNNPGLRVVTKQVPNAATLKAMESLVAGDRLVYAAAKARFGV